jgi:hypothetical protein
LGLARQTKGLAALSATCFGLGYRFVAGYAVRAYISRRRRRRY